MFSILKLIHILISNWLDNNANQRFSRQDVSPTGFFPDIYNDANGIESAIFKISNKYIAADTSSGRFRYDTKFGRLT